MDWSFSEKVIIASCRLIGIVFFETNDRSGNGNKSWVILIPIFYYTFSLYCITSTLLGYNQVYSKEESVLVASDFIAITMVGIGLIGRGCYYFIKRNDLASLICKVRLGSDVGVASRNHFPDKTI